MSAWVLACPVCESRSIRRGHVHECLSCGHQWQSTTEALRAMWRSLLPEEHTACPAHLSPFECGHLQAGQVKLVSDAVGGSYDLARQALSRVIRQRRQEARLAVIHTVSTAPAVDPS